MFFWKIEFILELLQHGFEKSAILLIYWNIYFTFENTDSCLQNKQHDYKDV